MTAAGLKRLRENRGLSQKELAEKTELSKEAIVSYENGRRKPDFDATIKLESFFGCNASTLAGVNVLYTSVDNTNQIQITREQFSFLNRYMNANRQAKEIIGFILDRWSRKTRTDATDREDLAPLVTIPVIGRAAAGSPIEMIREWDESISVDGARLGDFAVIASGDSMIDAGIEDGDRVIIRQQPEVEPGEIALVRIGGDSTIKRVYWDETGIKLVPENEAYKPLFYSNEDHVQIIGRLVKVVKKEDIK